MDWLTTLGANWLLSLIGLAVMGLVFTLLARLSPCNRGMSWLGDLRELATDLVYYLFVPIFVGFCRTVMLAGGIAAIVLCGVRPPLPVAEQTLWIQAVAILVIQDVIVYGFHRLFHTRLGWKFHAIHHSPHTLDWISAARVHPVNNLLAFALADVAVVLLGFSPAAIVFLMPITFAYSAMVHANLNWTFGPFFKYVFASPVFHRWHHTTQEAGLDKNFAPTFPVLDVLFGTFYMPAGELPEHYGNGDDQFPQGFWGQLAYPFQSSKPDTALTVTAAPRIPNAAMVRQTATFVIVISAVGFVIGLQLRSQTPLVPREHQVRDQFQQESDERRTSRDDSDSTIR